MNKTQVAKDALIEHKQHLLSDFKANQSIKTLLSEQSRFIDELLLSAWRHMGLNQFNIALVAVGGYGRAELHPYSDVDLLFLVDDNLSKHAEQLLGDYIAYLWDIGLEIGHSVRTIHQTTDQAKLDITIATNLLEARLITGDKTLFKTLYHSVRTSDFWSSYPFFIAKRDEQKLRHKKFNAFDLEPNVKSCPGGLRDIQTIGWVTMRHFNASRLEQLVSYGFLEQDELKELLKCQCFLWRLRFALHTISGRDENRLLFELQPQVAKLMGYQDGTQLAVEQMMKDYYRTVRRVLELNQMLLQLFKRAVLDHNELQIGLSNDQLTPATHKHKKILTTHSIDDFFQRRGRFIETLNGKIFNDPAQILNLFLVAINDSNITSIYAPTLRSLRRVRRALTQPLMLNEQCREIFMQILRHPRSIRAFSLMHKHGILSAYLPAWQAIEGQMQFDLFHAYTVDEHTHRLLLNIEQFASQDHQQEFPLSSKLFKELPKKGLLVLGAIFHDIAKGRGGDHSTLGAEDALAFCKLHKMNDHDGRLVAWLVKHHLLMSITAQRRDISDPDVIANFANIVSDSSHLNYLYCLTVADICATNNQIWNSWKGSLMRELYFSTQRMLSQGKEKPIDIRARVREHQGKARKELQRKGITDKALDELWLTFHADYFLKHMPNQIVWHAEAILKQRNKDEPLVLLSKHTTRGGTELFIYCPDSPKLFAIVMAMLDNKNVNVHDAMIMSSKDSYAIDTFIILEQNGKHVTHPARIQSIRKSLEKAITVDDIQSLKFRAAPRKIKPFKVATQVNFIPSNRHDTSMMELISLDTPGLLAKIGDVLYRCQIILVAAKITTIGERAEDFFMLQILEGAPLDEQQQMQLKENLIQRLSNSFN